MPLEEVVAELVSDAEALEALMLDACCVHDPESIAAPYQHAGHEATGNRGLISIGRPLCPPSTERELSCCARGVVGRLWIETFWEVTRLRETPAAITADSPLNRNV